MYRKGATKAQRPSSPRLMVATSVTLTIPTILVQALRSLSSIPIVSRMCEDVLWPLRTRTTQGQFSQRISQCSVLITHVYGTGSLILRYLRGCPRVLMVGVSVRFSGYTQYVRLQYDFYCLAEFSVAQPDSGSEQSKRSYRIKISTTYINTSSKTI